MSFAYDSTQTAPNCWDQNLQGATVTSFVLWAATWGWLGFSTGRSGAFTGLRSSDDPSGVPKRPPFRTS